jgi:hypothetical protein
MESPNGGEASQPRAAPWVWRHPFGHTISISKTLLLPKRHAKSRQLGAHPETPRG